jgi:hypothetical protein
MKELINVINAVYTIIHRTVILTEKRYNEISHISHCLLLFNNDVSMAVGIPLR